MMYTLNLHNVAWQLYLHKSRGKKKTKEVTRDWRGGGRVMGNYSLMVVTEFLSPAMKVMKMLWKQIVVMVQRHWECT